MTIGMVRSRLNQNRSRNWAAWSPWPPCAPCPPCSPWPAWCWWSISPLLMAARIPGWRSGTHQSGDGVGSLGHDRLGLPIPAGHAFAHAVPQVPVQQVHRDALEGLVHGSDLGEHVDAVGVL